jgi:hypothetical protein
MQHVRPDSWRFNLELGQQVEDEGSGDVNPRRIARQVLPWGTKLILCIQYHSVPPASTMGIAWVDISALLKVVMAEA